MGPQKIVIQQRLANSGISFARRNPMLLRSTNLIALLSYQICPDLACTTIAIDQLVGCRISNNQVDRLALPWHEK